MSDREEIDSGPAAGVLRRYSHRNDCAWLHDIEKGPEVRDGRRDLIRSVPDVLASTANFLKRHGWRRDQGWQPGSTNFRVIKEWNRAWKIALIEKSNPEWHDLYEELG